MSSRLLNARFEYVDSTMSACTFTQVKRCKVGRHMEYVRATIDLSERERQKRKNGEKS